MRHIPFLSLALASALAFSGCASTPPPDPQPADQQAEQTPEPAAQDADSQSDQLAEQVKAQAERLQLLLAENDTKHPEPQSQHAQPPQADDPSAPRPDVVWLDAPHLHIDPKSLDLTPPTASAQSPAPAPAATADEPAEATADEGDAATPKAPAKTDRQQLIAQLLRDIRQSDDPAMVKALRMAALNLLDGKNNTLDLAGFNELNAEQREVARRYQQTLAQLAQSIVAGEQFDAAALTGHLYQIFGRGPIMIRQAVLCRSVRSYGVYEPFAGNTFLAGREQAIIVYAELDQFRAERGSDDQYEVRLSQEILLYNETDGLAVWQQPRVEIVDRSRNERRDFFVVQLIRLPARLTVGKYLLKVRINDVHGSSVDETTLPIQLVADEAMVRNGQK